MRVKRKLNLKKENNKSKELNSNKSLFIGKKEKSFKRKKLLKIKKKIKIKEGRINILKREEEMNKGIEASLEIGRREDMTKREKRKLIHSIKSTIMEIGEDQRKIKSL